MLIMIVVFNGCLGCRLLSHCDNRIHWPCLYFFSPIDGRIQVQLQITKVQMQMKINIRSNKNKRGSSRQLNKYSFHQSIFDRHRWLHPVPPSSQTSYENGRPVYTKGGESLRRAFIFHFFAFTQIFLFLIFAPPRYLMDVPHHWEGWVVGEELGSLSNDGDADCPVWIRSFLSLNDLFANTFEIYHTITFIIAQASLGSGWDVANGNDWQEDSSLTITCSFWFYCM